MYYLVDDSLRAVIVKRRTGHEKDARLENGSRPIAHQFPAELCRLGIEFRNVKDAALFFVQHFHFVSKRSMRRIRLGIKSGARS